LHFEVLVHDDASSDDTAAIISEYEAKYPHIFKPVYQKQNQFSQGIRYGGLSIPKGMWPVCGYL
jgi:glycosyltransferase involved in cell wall biosynthesis